jgi:hypothetical protein
MTERPQTEVWFRTPLPYLSEARELGVKNWCMDFGYMQKKHIENPVAWATLQFGLDADWRLLVPDHFKGEATLWESGTRDPVGIFPMWMGHEPFGKLIELIEDPWAERKKQIFTRRIPEQDHVIVVSELPSLQDAGPSSNNSLSPGVRFYNELSEIQEEFPDVKIILHGSYAFSKMFGLSFKAVTYDPSQASGAGRVFLPNGKTVTFARDKYAPKLGYWYNLLGHTYAELKESRTARRYYNVKSALFAGRYYKSLDRFRVSRGLENMMAPEIEDFVKTNSMVFTRNMAAQPGDRVVCDDCSLWMGCKLFREGAICAVGNSPMKDVNKLFKTRDSDSIIKALTALAATNAERAEAALEVEAKAMNSEEGGEVDPDLTKLLESTFKMGDRLLQIVDPSQRTGRAAVNVNVGSGAQRVEITQSQPQQQVAHIYSMLEAQGYSRDQITPELVAEVLENLGGTQPQIENGKVIQGEVA